MNQTTSSSSGRLPYVSPGIEVIEVAYEGVIAGSGTDIPGISGGGEVGGGLAPTNLRSNTYYGSSTSELEDLINDILTIEQ